MAIARIRDRAARRELAEICSSALASASDVAPALSEDFGTQTFLNGAVVPIVLDLVSNPTNLPDPSELSKRYVEIFVEGFTRNGDVDAVLKRVFQTDRENILAAFEAFFKELKFRLAGSQRWSELQHRQVAEATFQKIEQIHLLLKPPASAVNALDLENAKNQARSASVDLVDWPRDIFGETIDRPEFRELERRVVDEPSGSTLLIGAAGSGKSALLSTLTDAMSRAGRAVLAIKADQLPADVRTIEDVAKALGITEDLGATIKRLAADGPMLLVIDQLDAVSDVMDRSSFRMRLLLRLVASLRPPNGLDEHCLPVHVIVSSRPFEADHDARFLQLDAERVNLALLAKPQVDGLLTALDIQPDTVPESMAETARRPFALKLIVDLVRRGIPIDDLLPGQLLDRWLETADLGDGAMRQQVIGLLTDLAKEMIETETLWRPEDRFAMGRLDALNRASACGLIIRNDRRQISFSHQSWLDDFQSKQFSSGRSVAEYAWRAQDSLFPRAAVLRALQRLRAVDEPAYLSSIDLLLGQPQTRRHLRHLITDLISGMETPNAREAAWVEQLLESDVALARRALPRVLRNWSSWRVFALRWLPALMARSDLDWFAANALGAEAAFDGDKMMNLIDRYWTAVDKDEQALRAIDQSELWTPRMQARACQIISRASPDTHFVWSIMRERLRRGHIANALDFVATFFETGEPTERLHRRIHDLSKLTEAAPEAFADRLFGRFVSMAARETRPNGSRREAFDESTSLPWDWSYHDGDHSFYKELRRSLHITAARTPSRLISIITPFYNVEIAQVQQMIADALASAGQELAQAGLAFLEADPRRLDIGHAHGTDDDGVGRLVYGWSSQQLVAAIVPALSEEDITRLRDLIEGWSRYSKETIAEVPVGDRRQFLRWADEARFPLLENLPTAIIGARRRRQIEEWRVDEPIIRSVNRIGMANYIGSPMGSDAMERAIDDELIGMLDSIHDASGDIWHRRRPLSGGVRELAQAFGAFAGANPERALQLIETRMSANRHTKAAGAALLQLAKAEAADPERVRALIHELDKKGFGGEAWRHEAAWAFENLATRMSGLLDDDIAILERWIERDGEVIAAQIASRIEFARENEARNEKGSQGRREARAMLFGRDDGIQILPQRNYSLLVAIAAGFLRRPDPDCAAWVAVLERHVGNPEDPEIWANILLRHSNALWWIEKDRASKLIQSIWDTHKDTFDQLILVGTIWSMRTLIPRSVLEAIVVSWIEGDVKHRQAAGELLGGMMMADEPTSYVAALSHAVMEEGPSPQRTGLLFSVAAAWHEDAELRERAHAVMTSIGLSIENYDEAYAWTRSVSQRSKPLPADKYTRQILNIIASNPHLLSAANSNFFLDAIQNLLLHPGFDGDVLELVDKLSVLAIERSENGGRLFDGDLVHVAVALQRNDGSLRKRAMDVYERLLDAEAYGAAEAAEAALVRTG